MLYENWKFPDRRQYLINIAQVLFSIFYLQGNFQWLALSSLRFVWRKENLCKKDINSGVVMKNIWVELNEGEDEIQVIRSGQV